MIKPDVIAQDSASKQTSYYDRGAIIMCMLIRILLGRSFMVTKLLLNCAV